MKMPLTAAGLACAVKTAAVFHGAAAAVVVVAVVVSAIFAASVT